MNVQVIPIHKPEDMNFILGQSHFIKSVEDIHEALVQTVPNIEFGLAFCEASGPRLIRYSGNNNDTIDIAKLNAQKIGAGHHFIIFIKNAFPINVLPIIRQIPEVCRIFCATANPVEVIIAETDLGRGILGVIDGQSPLDVEGEEDILKRKKFLRQIGYKL